MAVKFYQPENQVPLEMHKVRVVQKLFLLPVEERLKRIQEAGISFFFRKPFIKSPPPVKRGVRSEAKSL